MRPPLFFCMLGDKRCLTCACVTIYLKYLKYFFLEKKKFPNEKRVPLASPQKGRSEGPFESKSPKSLSSLSSLMLSARRVQTSTVPLARCIDLRETISTLPGSPRPPPSSAGTFGRVTAHTGSSRTEFSQGALRSPNEESQGLWGPLGLRCQERDAAGYQHKSCISGSRSLMSIGLAVRVVFLQEGPGSLCSPNEDSQAAPRGPLGLCERKGGGWVPTQILFQ